jgi:large subunit ribosomal protein L35Ae
MSESTQGMIVNYRIGVRTQNSKECLIHFANVSSVCDASRLIGRKVAWKMGKIKIIGTILDAHGQKGVVRARFRRGVPGQALGTVVELVG